MLYTSEMEHIRAQLDQAKLQISAIKNSRARRDLDRMYNTVESILSDISREQVNCRRLHRETSLYQNLVKKAEEYMLNLSQNITFATLIYG